MIQVSSRANFKLKRFARYIGLYKRTITMPDGVRYRERSGVSIRRALSEHGSGVKEYDVRFPWVDSEGRRGLRIRYTASRLFGDVGHDPRTVLYSQALGLITPGLRVLELGCGTGSGSAILTEAVGPSGGLVAIDRDGQAIRFARQRHRSGHCGFENGWIENLQGEIEGAFDAVVVVDPLRGINESAEGIFAIVEITRLVRSGGSLVVIASQKGDLEVLSEGFGAGFTLQRELEPCPRSAWSGVVFRRAGEQSPPVRFDLPSPGPFKY